MDEIEIYFRLMLNTDKMYVPNDGNTLYFLQGEEFESLLKIARTEEGENFMLMNRYELEAVIADFLKN